MGAPQVPVGVPSMSPPLQVYTAIYYVLADLAMLSLYCYYRVKNGGRACELGHGGSLLCSPGHWEQREGSSRALWEPGDSRHSQ